jgi:hypothetical protein
MEIDTPVMNLSVILDQLLRCRSNGKKYLFQGSCRGLCYLSRDRCSSRCFQVQFGVWDSDRKALVSFFFNDIFAKLLIELYLSDPPPSQIYWCVSQASAAAVSTSQTSAVAIITTSQVPTATYLLNFPMLLEVIALGVLVAQVAVIVPLLAASGCSPRGYSLALVIYNGYSSEILIMSNMIQQ